MADYGNWTHNDDNEDLRLPLHIHQGDQYYEQLRYERPPEMTPPPRLSETEYMARKPIAPVTSADREGFAFDHPPAVNFTHEGQTVMNSQAQCIVLGETYALHQGVARGGFSGKSDADMKKQNNDAIHLLATAAEKKYPHQISKFEVLRHNYIALVKENIRTCHKLGLTPPDEVAHARTKRLAIKTAIATNIERLLADWERSLGEYEEGIRNGSIDPAFKGNFPVISATFAEQLQVLELKRIAKVKGTIAALRASATRHVATEAELALFPRGVEYDFMTHRERKTFWDARFDIFKYEFYSRFGGFLDLKANFDDAIMGEWLKYIFAVIMNSLWTNHIGPQIQQKLVVENYQEHDVRVMFEMKRAAGKASSDFRGVRATYGGTFPTFANLKVYQSVLYGSKRPIPLRKNAVNTELPFVAPEVYEAE